MSGRYEHFVQTMKSVHGQKGMNLQPTIVGLPDITIDYISHTPSSIELNDLVHVNYRTENIGNSDADRCDIGVFISDDPVYNPGSDELLDDWTQGSLDVDEIDVDDLNFDIPRCYDCGQYYILLVLDYLNEISESNTDNNVDYFEINITGCTDCTYSLDESEQQFPSGGGTGSISVNADYCCEWGATTNPNWINLLVDNGSGEGNVFYEVEPCTEGGNRVGTINIEGQTFTVNQNCDVSCNTSNTFEWAISEGGPDLSDDVSDMYVDESGNIYLTGEFQGTVDFSGITLNSSGTNAPEGFVAKYSNDGILSWVTPFGGEEQEEGYAITMDNSGNLYIVGEFEGETNFGSIPLNNPIGDRGNFIAKLNNAGVFQWVYKLPEDIYPTDIVSNGSAVFITGSNDDLMFIAKYTSNGSQEWIKTSLAEAYSEHTGRAIEIDNENNIIVTGELEASMEFNGIQIEAPGPPAVYFNENIFLGKFNASGICLWLKQAGWNDGNRGESGEAITIDENNNIYITGRSAYSPVFENDTLSGSSWRQLFIAKYNSNGNYIWAKQTPNTDASGKGIVALSNDEIVVASYFRDTFSLDSTSYISVSNTDWVLLGLNSSGNILWSKNIGGQDSDSPESIGKDQDGNIIVCGNFREDATFDNTLLNSAGSTDLFLAKLNRCDLPNITINSNNPLAICEGEPIDLTSDNYCDSYSYQWFVDGLEIDGANSPSLNTSTEGDYHVEVEVSEDCLAVSNTLEISSENTPEPFITGGTGVCEGDSVFLDAGAGYTSYLWSNGGNAQTIYATDGLYSVTVENNIGCSGTAFHQINLFSIVEPTILGETSICEGNQVEITGNDGYESYSWSTGSELQSITVGVGNYTLTVTDNNGCNAMESIDISEDAIVTLDPANQFFEFSENSGICNVATSSGCSWTVTEDCSWVTITSGAAGTGNGTINFDIEANPSLDQRECIITVEGETFTISQDGIDCQFTLNPTEQTYSASSNSGSFSVTTQSGCNWTASEDCTWVSITSGSSGTGNGTVNYAIDANPTIEERECIITVEGQTFTITQSGDECQYALDPTEQTYSASSNSGSFSVTTQSGCNWTAGENCEWVEITSGSSGTGSGTVNYNVEANPLPEERECVITVEGETFTITQDGADCQFTLNPTEQTYSASSNSGSFNVTTQTGCSWTAGENCEWVEITSGSSGTGSGTVNYNVEANPLPQERECVITVEGETFTITQDGADCQFTLNPTEQTYSASSNSGSFNVTTQSGCSWTASEDCSWVEITSGSGIGNGAVSYVIDPNNSGVERSCTIMVADQSYIIIQNEGTDVPIADFYASQTSGTSCENTPLIIDFFDNSTNNPTSWEWTFFGAIPDSSFDQNPTGIMYPETGTFTVKLKVTNSSGYDQSIRDSYIAVLTDNCTGIFDFEGIDQVSIMPNPTKDLVNILLTSHIIEGFKIEVYSFEGKKIIAKEGMLIEGENDIVLNLAGHPSGVYLMKMKINNEVATFKVVKLN